MSKLLSSWLFFQSPNIRLTYLKAFVPIGKSFSQVQTPPVLVTMVPYICEYLVIPSRGQWNVVDTIQPSPFKRNTTRTGQSKHNRYHLLELVNPKTKHIMFVLPVKTSPNVIKWRFSIDRDVAIPKPVNTSNLSFTMLRFQPIPSPWFIPSLGRIWPDARRNYFLCIFLKPTWTSSDQQYIVVFISHRCS